MDRLESLLRKYRAASGWLLALAGIAAYRGVLACGFVYDDVELVLQNPFVKNPRLWKSIFLGSMFSFEGAGSQGNFYRPLTIFSFWLVCRVAGLQPIAYHLLLLTLYAVSIWIVYRIGARILGNESAAFAGALLWAVNPLHVEVVAWVSSLQDIGCTFFSLVGFWMFLRAEERAPANYSRHVAAAAAYFPALFFKEMAFSFPILLLAYWFCFGSMQTWARRAVNWSPYLVAVGICAAVRIAVLGHFSQGSSSHAGVTRMAAAALAILGQHAKLFVWPVNLSEFRDFDLNASLRSPWLVVALSVVIVAVVLRRRAPRLSFAVLWWFVCLLPVLNYRQLSIPVIADRFSYTASIGLCLGLGYFFVVVVPRRFSSMTAPAVCASGLVVLAVVWTVQTARTIPNWRNNESLFNYGLQFSPNAAEVHQVHGVVLQFRERDLEGAAREFRTALKLDAESIHRAPGVTYSAIIGLGQVALLEGHEPEALDYFQDAIRLSPGSYFAYDVMGAFYFPRRDYSRAAEYYQRAVKVDPQDVNAYYALGLCWMKLGKPALAAEQFHSARTVDPTFREAFVAEASALDAMGDGEGASKLRTMTPK